MLNIRSSLPEDKIVLESGVEVGCFSSGDGSMNLVLLHGLNSYSGTWKKNVQLFSLFGRVLAPTLPKVNTENMGALGDAVMRLSDIVLGLIKHFAFRRATIVGNSMGGWIGLYLALNHPGIINGLVLVDSAGVTMQKETPTAHPADINQHLSAITQPVLIVWGKNDPLISVETGQRLHKSIKGSRFEVIEGAGHIPHLQRPVEFNRIVSDFFNENRESLSAD